MSNDYGQPCVIRSGESVTILQDGFRLPDGTTVTSIENCEFETDSSVVLEEPTDPTAVTAPAQVTEVVAVELPVDPTPSTPHIIPTHVPKSFSPTADELPDPHTDTTVAAVVVEQAAQQVNVTDSGVSAAVVAAVAVVATVAVASSGAKGKKGKGTRQQKRSPEQQRREREERQKECATKSNRVDQHIQQVVDLAASSRTASLDIRDPAELYGEIELVSQEVAVLNRTIRRRQKRNSQ